MAKEEIVYCRVSKEMKDKITAEAGDEADAVVVRAALNEYFARKDAASREDSKPAAEPTPARPEPKVTNRRGQPTKAKTKTTHRKKPTLSRASEDAVASQLEHGGHTGDGAAPAK